MHFGRQMRKERLARAWSLAEMARRSGIDAGHLSRVENGKRPPTEKIAQACDDVFPERKGWFTEYYGELHGWSEVPASFRSWPEHEDNSKRLLDWCPSIVTGLLQTEDYARALTAVQPQIDEDTIATRVAGRMGRQKRVFGRDVLTWFIVDELSLYRLVGSTQIMAAQLRHLATMAAMPRVTIQVLPAVAHPVNASGFMIADDAVWVEHAASGYVFTDEETIEALALRFDTLRGECYRVSETAALLERLERTWTAGVSPLTQTATAETA
jgi:predicted transcriptional regulator